MNDLIPSKSRASVMNEIPPPPARCHVMNCNEYTSVAVLQVRNNNRMLSGAFFDFGYVHRGHNNQSVLTLHNEYSYLGWITRCAHHYCEDVESCQSSALRKPANVLNAQSEHLKVKSGKDLVRILKTLSRQQSRMD